MKKHSLPIAAVLIGIAVLPVALAFYAEGPSVLLVTNSDGPGSKSTLAAMESLGWTVDSAQWYEAVDFTAADLAANFDVVWILPPRDVDALFKLNEAGGSLEAFVDVGGIVVSVGVNVPGSGLDIGVGGLDYQDDADAGATTILESEHPFLTGLAGGGQSLSGTDLDPAGTGGGAYFFNPPAGSTLTDIARNTAGTNICEYTYGQGTVIISLLGLLEEGCLNNLLHYVGSLVQ